MGGGFISQMSEKASTTKIFKGIVRVIMAHSPDARSLQVHYPAN